jgi:hypothetical protein
MSHALLSTHQPVAFQKAGAACVHDADMAMHCTFKSACLICQYDSVFRLTADRAHAKTAVASKSSHLQNFSLSDSR